MKAWLCPVKPNSWRTTKREQLFGVSTIGRKLLSLVTPGDLLVFYVLSPAGGVVAICRAKSKMFKDYTDLWGPGRYPYRVKTELLLEFPKPLSRSRLIGRTDDEQGFEIIPYFRGVEIVEIVGIARKRALELIEEQ